MRSGTALAIMLTHIVQPLSYNETNNNLSFQPILTSGFLGADVHSKFLICLNYPF